MPPELRNILLVAVAPHLSIDRAIVLAEGSSVSITVNRPSGASTGTGNATLRGVNVSGAGGTVSVSSIADMVARNACFASLRA